MRPEKARSVFERITEVNAKIIGDIQHQITKAAQETFTNERF